MKKFYKKILRNKTLKFLVKSGIAKIILFILILLSISVFFIIFVEKDIHNPLQAIYWGVVTITTVGYGDITPKTGMGEIISIFTILGGVILFSLFTATISSHLISNKLKEEQGLKQIAFKNHLIICGWNWTVEKTLKSLFKLSEDIKIVIVNDLKPEDASVILDEFSDYDLKFVRGDFSLVPVLEKANVKYAKSVMIVPDYSTPIASSIDDKTVFATMSVKSISEKIKVFVHILDQNKVPYVKRARANEIMLSDKFIPYFLASNILSPGISEVLSDLLDYDNKNTLITSKIPAEFVGKTYLELFTYFKKETNSLLIGFVQLHDILKMKDTDITETNSIDSFIKRKFEEAGRLTRDLEKKKIIINPDNDSLINSTYEYAVLIQKN